MPPAAATKTKPPSKTKAASPKAPAAHANGRQSPAPQPQAQSPAPAPAAPPKQPPAIVAAAKARTKGEIALDVSLAAGITTRQATAALDRVAALAAADLGGGGPKAFTVPGVCTLKVAVKPATQARQGRNLATGEPMTIEGKAARNVIKVMPVKSLREGV